PAHIKSISKVQAARIIHDMKQFQKILDQNYPFIENFDLQMIKLTFQKKHARFSTKYYKRKVGKF
ncbi:hypothetical protein BpHYR1_016176, partial [Brachionus plicatilis]